MKIYKISQDVNREFETFDSMIVCAKDENEARRIHPNIKNWDGKDDYSASWCDLEYVKVEYIGQAAEGIKQGVILASYNPG